MPKAHKLPISTQRAIAKRKEADPTLPAGELARIYHCTANQVYSALQRHRAGLLRDRRGSKAKRIAPHQEGDAIADFVRLSHTTIATLTADRSISALEMVPLLDKLAGILKTGQQMQLHSAIRGTHAGVIATIIRRYQPDATDTDIIRIYKESLEACKAGLL